MGKLLNPRQVREAAKYAANFDDEDLVRRERQTQEESIVYVAERFVEGIFDDHGMEMGFDVEDESDESELRTSFTFNECQEIEDANMRLFGLFQKEFGLTSAADLLRQEMTTLWDRVVVTIDELFAKVLS